MLVYFTLNHNFNNNIFKQYVIKRNNTFENKLLFICLLFKDYVNIYVIVIKLNKKGKL